ncbi:hypothetical protein [Ferruginibacter albus]|uniref:hypothetical protein n=1 Tax=Ferruginibacter albus TaxID=2875540 RepID=UPI001CC6B2A6|nr:hypothetical protein [Ferruginibacter albus]UAY52111.1 hypothetical protein K9M53_00100 [Ferruginibacter albus]
MKHLLFTLSLLALISCSKTPTNPPQNTLKSKHIKFEVLLSNGTWSGSYTDKDGTTQADHESQYWMYSYVNSAGNPTAFILVNPDQFDDVPGSPVVTTVSIYVDSIKVKTQTFKSALTTLEYKL